MQPLLSLAWRHLCTSTAGLSPRAAPQVLGNAELRERYDAGGQKSLDINFMEAQRPARGPRLYLPLG